jgi:hypothetical protein
LNFYPGNNFIKNARKAKAGGMYMGTINDKHCKSPINNPKYEK